MCRWKYRRPVTLADRTTLGRDGWFPEHSRLAYAHQLEPFGLFRVGWAVFADIGRAWYEDAAPAWVPPRNGDHFNTLADVGVGLRLESIRTRGDRVIHIDLAKPLVDGPSVRSLELTLTVKRSI